MNRQIKFRAWHKTDKVMLDWLTLRQTAFNIDQPSPLMYRVFIDHNTDDSVFVLQQYVGLKDKNGKEIYEGDIVEAWSQGSRGVFQIWWRQEGNPCWILYPNGQNRQMWNISATEHNPGKVFIGVDAKITETEKVGYYDDGLIVIGNIYEKPELLK